MTRCVLDDRSAAGPRWFLAPELSGAWPGGWPVPEWLSAGTACIVKKGPQRTVLRIDLPGGSIYLKQHHLPDRLTRLRQSLRAPKAKRECDRLAELVRRGVPVPEPLGWGVWPQWPRESVVVTRAIDDVTSLSRLFVEGQLDALARQSLAESLGRFLARLHSAGVDHRDLHLGNVMVRRCASDFDLYLVDLDAVRLGAPLDRPRSLANLALFGAGCFQATWRSDRLRFLHAYVAARGWFDVARDLAGGRELFAIARAIERETWTYNLDFWAHRDRRCLVANRYYRKTNEGAFSGMAVRGIDDDWLARFTSDPEAPFREPGVKILKHSKTSTVAEITTIVDGVPRQAILKKIGATSWSDPLTALVRPTPILRSWVSGQGFLERNLPTPRPLVMLHRRQRGLSTDGYLVTESLADVQELDAYVVGLDELPAAERRRRLRRQIDRVARAVQAMHQRHVSHRDLKAANLLVMSLAVEDTAAGAPRPIQVSPFPVPSTTVWFIDLVGVTRYKRIPTRRRIQNITRLNASFLNSKSLTRTDRLRFLRIYLAWGIHGKCEWKPLWRAIEGATSAKAERNKKLGRALE